MIFEPIFEIYEAKNGEDAFKIAQLNSPDLILSDVMMPGISGINLCARIKSHFDTSHIPWSFCSRHLVVWNTILKDSIVEPMIISPNHLISEFCRKMH